MTEIRYIQGDATSPQAKGAKIIAHVCNDLGGWGKGFVLAISQRWPEPEAAYRAWHLGRAGNDFGLGAMQLVQVNPHTWVANLIAQRGIRPSRKHGPPIRYDALARCLASLASDATRMKASVHVPRIGCGLAGGRWELVEPLIIQHLTAAEIPCTVYDTA